MSVQKTSESVYAAMCQEIGKPQQVASRRDRMNEIEWLMNKIPKLIIGKQLEIMLSGSQKEGLRLRGSDIDIMFWPSDYRVIWDYSQSQLYTTQRQTMIICDSFQSPPGFYLLRLPKEYAQLLLLPACVQMNGELYISSSKYKQIIKKIFFPESTSHGPCCSGSIGHVEYDIAKCFVCDFWPPSASSWIDRCHSWPPPNVVNDVVKSGCHFVAIGHKLGNQADNEWRVSFSQAEHKLVYAMNHAQFITYGLLKLFLKEIINNGIRDEEKLLCSYHIKTSILWAIQQSPLHQWCPQNILGGFWICFKLLLKWVYEGVCPNFFIPQNNIFLSESFIHKQKNLFRQLHGLYEKGIALLLYSPSIRIAMTKVLCNPRIQVYVHTAVSEVEFDVDLFHEIIESDILHPANLQHCMIALLTAEHLLRSPLTQYQVVIVQKLITTILQCTAFLLSNMHTYTKGNKTMYIADTMSCHMLKLAARFGNASGLLYLAMYYYKTLRYREALSVIEMTKAKLAKPHLMYRRHVDIEKYTEVVGGRSLSTKMRQALVWDIKLINKICYIKELMAEQHSRIQNSPPVLYVPPLIMLHMLEFLCKRHVDTIEAREILHNLQVLLQHDQQLHVAHVTPGDISWEVLGICHQIAGNLQAALYSYHQSLKQDPFNKIQIATMQRIRDLHVTEV